MNHADFDRFKLEILAWQERYFALVKEVANIEGMRRAPMMLADKESYELGRLHGATEEREACAKLCDDKAKETFSGQCQVWGDYFANAIRERKS